MSKVAFRLLEIIYMVSKTYLETNIMLKVNKQ